MRASIESCVVRRQSCLRDAMLALDKGALGIALVVEEGWRLVGTVSDGDVRRALLAGATLESPVDRHMQREFTCVAASSPRPEVLELMQASRIAEIPIVDAEGRLLGLHLLHDIVGASERPNWAVIMAGGRGARLAPLTEHTPKPMLRVAGRPILERIVLHLVGFGIRRIFLSINYLGNVIEDHFGDGHQLGCSIEYLREDAPLGTGGALSLLPELPKEPLLVMNGDLVTTADLGAMLDEHMRLRPPVTVGVRRYFHRVPFGCVDIDGTRIRRIEEKPMLSQLVNAGIYIFGPEVLARVPRGTSYPLPALVEDSLTRGEVVSAYEIQDDWVDVGQKEQLRAARGEGTAS